jgi:hypothetical protein
MRTLGRHMESSSPDRCSPRRRGLGVVRRRIEVDLTPQAVDRVATRMLKLLREDELWGRAWRGRESGYMTASELAAYLKLNTGWVYEHAEELGAIRTGQGPKARIRFDVERAIRALERRREQVGEGGGITGATTENRTTKEGKTR